MSRPGQAGSIGDSQPDPARVANYLLGGTVNYPVDRIAGEELLDLYPGLQLLARQHRAFTVSAVAWTARTQGIRQFLDLGCGLAPAPSVADAARAVNRDSAVVYVDKDPVVLSHVRALEAAGPGLGAVLADVRDVAALLTADGLREVINLGEPACAVFGGTLSCMDVDEARATVRGYAWAMAPGSAVIASCAHFDDATVTERIAAVLPQSGWRNHSRADIESFFSCAGLQVTQGVVTDVRHWPLAGAELAQPAIVVGGVGIRG